MKLDDIIALAKQGYKPSDIKELIQLADTAPKDDAPEQEANEQKPVDEPEQPAEEPENAEPAIDYKELYEQSQAQLKAAQRQNINQNIQPGGPSDQDILNDYIRGLM